MKKFKDYLKEKFGASVVILMTIMLLMLVGAIREGIMTEKYGIPAFGFIFFSMIVGLLLIDWSREK